MLRCFASLLLLTVIGSAAFAKEKFQHPGPIHLDHRGEKWAEKTLRKLSLEEKIGQLFMIWVRAEFLNMNSPEYLQLRDQMQKYHVGSFAMTVRFEPPFLYRNQPYEAAELLNRLQRDSKLPLLVAADFERGVTMRLQGATTFPHAMAFGATGKLDYAEAFGRITAQEARAIGVHWNFFPDADVNSNPANPIINTRSFGEDPQQVGDLVAAYIRGARADGMMVTIKHFPGHGDTATDSHLSVAQVTGDKNRLQSVELPPFRKGIEAGVDAVMVAQVTVPALERGPNRVATKFTGTVQGPLKQTGTVAGGLPYQRVEEVRNNLVVVVLSEDVRTEAGRVLERQFKARVPDANVIYVDPRIAGAMSDEVLKAVDQAGSVVAAVYVVPTAGRIAKADAGGLKNSVGLADASGSLLQNILDHAGQKTAVLAMGNPYLAQDFPTVENYICTFSNATVSEISVVKALFGEIAIRGHLPVSIPNVAQRGAGIERPSQVAQEGSGK